MNHGTDADVCMLQTDGIPTFRERRSGGKNILKVVMKIRNLLLLEKRRKIIRQQPTKT
jgi:hypothetical protein